MIALVPIEFAVNEFDSVLAAYMADSHTLYTASAFASLTILRSNARINPMPSSTTTHHGEKAEMWTEMPPKPLGVTFGGWD